MKQLKNTPNNAATIHVGLKYIFKKGFVWALQLQKSFPRRIQ